jgi:hypothetical protein
MYTTAEIAEMGPDAVWQLTDTGLLLAEIENRLRAKKARERLTEEDLWTLAKINRHEAYIDEKRAKGKKLRFE